MGGFRDHEAALYPTSADPAPGDPDGFLPIMFVHLPRTAGTTIKRTLESVFGARRSLLDLHFYDTAHDDLSRFAVIEGHKRATYFGNVFGSAWFANGLTMMRKPVPRVISQARHIRALEHHRDHGLLVGEVDDPTELFDNVLMLGNLQTKLLSGKSPRVEQVGAPELEAAKAVLERVAFGLTESFDLSMCLFAERFALDFPKFGVAGASPADGDDDLRSNEFKLEARRRNKLDVELYTFAAAMFAERVERYVAALLDLPLDEASLECSLRSGAGGVQERRQGVYRRRGTTSVRLRGWIVIDGRPADAVLVRAADVVTPLCGRIASSSAGRRTSSVSNRHAGFVGNVPLPPGTESVELIALDRRRHLRAEQVFEVHDVDDAPPARDAGPAPPSADAEPAPVC